MNLKWWCKDYKDLSKDETKIVNIVSSQTKYIFCKSGNNWLARPISYEVAKYDMDAGLFKRIVGEMMKRHYQYSCEGYIN